MLLALSPPLVTTTTTTTTTTTSLAARAPRGLAENAVQLLVAALPPALLRGRLAREKLRRADRLVARYELDLAAFLNARESDELAALCAHFHLSAETPGAQRQRLWAHGAAHERHILGLDPGPSIQPPALLVKGRLQLGSARRQAPAARGVLPSARAARFPHAASYPRPVPPPTDPPDATVEPATLDELLARANALLGVRLGARGRDKGAYGARISDLLGIARSSAAEPDWRGEVEVKTLAVVRAAGATWRIKDGPAIAMRSIDAHAKLQRVLWIIRADEGEVPGAPILSWYYQELDVPLSAALERARHLRPKGGANTDKRGWYLRRDFFVSCGLLTSLNGDR